MIFTRPQNLGKPRVPIETKKMRIAIWSRVHQISARDDFSGPGREPIVKLQQDGDNQVNERIALVISNMNVKLKDTEHDTAVESHSLRAMTYLSVVGNKKDSYFERKKNFNTKLKSQKNILSYRFCYRVNP